MKLYNPKRLVLFTAHIVLSVLISLLAVGQTASIYSGECRRRIEEAMEQAGPRLSEAGWPRSRNNLLR